jgi:hypothetical protein
MPLSSPEKRMGEAAWATAGQSADTEIANAATIPATGPDLIDLNNFALTILAPFVS